MRPKQKPIYCNARQWLWIGTPIHPNDTRKQVVYSHSELERAGFTPAHVQKCARGQRLQHKGMIWKSIPWDLGVTDTRKACADELIRALSLGCSGRANTCAEIVAYNLITGKRERYKALRDVVAAGFDAGCVKQVICGRRDKHKGHTFTREAPEIVLEPLPLDDLDWLKNYDSGAELAELLAGDWS